LANIKSAIKRARQNDARREHNASRMTRLRTHIKNVIKAVAGGELDQALSAYQLAQPVIDQAASKKLIHKNKAARHKSRLVASIKKLEKRNNEVTSEAT
jgi:small subunit ribosomal protein S20